MDFDWPCVVAKRNKASVRQSQSLVWFIHPAEEREYAESLALTCNVLSFLSWVKKSHQTLTLSHWGFVSFCHDTREKIGSSKQRSQRPEHDDTCTYMDRVMNYCRGSLFRLSVTSYYTQKSVTRLAWTKCNNKV